MPSFLDSHTSESVSLTTSNSSPYEPPHPASSENSLYDVKPPWALPNGTNGDISGKSNREGEGRNLSGKARLNGNLLAKSGENAQSLKLLPNGRSSGSTDRMEKAQSNNSSCHSLTNGLDGCQVHGREAKTDSLIPPAATDAGSGNMNGNVLQPAKQDPMPAGHAPHHGSGRHSTHTRAHSSSAPQSISQTNYLHSSNDVSQGTVRASTGPTTRGQESKPLSRFSSPPTLLPTDQNLTATTTSSLPAHPGAIRLQHRHTLQVPRLSTGRNSRDFSLPIGSNPEDTSIDVDRLSPINPGRGSISLARRPTRSVHSDIYLDEIPQDDDMARWTEAIRQKRASRRKRKDEEEDDRVVVGTKVDMNHVNWVTAYNMLTGIRFTVSRTNAKIDRELTDGDFDARHKFSFDITGNELTPSAKYDFKFKDYAPWVFRHIRARFKLDPADYLMSLTSKYILSELGSPGKSGSFFYFSRDYKYIIKTIHHAEHKLLRKVLRDYYKHINSHPNTLLSQFYGLHRVKIPYGRKIHFVVMNNLFPPHRDIHQTFDLKGSTIGRDFKEEDLEKNPRATLKDLNWLRRNYHFEFGPEKKKVFVEQMKADVELLQRLKIMDYSLLVGIHDLSKGNEENLRDRTLKVFQPGGDQSAEPQSNLLTRTPSKLENQRKARQLRQIIKKEKPVPMEKSTSKMPDEMLEERKSFIFYSDDGGFQATHEDGEPGEEIYYLGIIDCLTHYGLVKRAEHLWKGMSHNKTQISPIPPEGYGNRFVKFITGLTMTKEEVEREHRSTDQTDGSIHTDRQPSFSLSRQSTDKVIQRAEKQAQKTEKQGALEDSRRDRTLGALRSSSVERTSGVVGAILPVVEEAGEAGSREDSLGQETLERQLSRDPALADSLKQQRPQEAQSSSSSGHKHLPSLPFIPRLSMGMSTSASSPPTNQ